MTQFFSVGKIIKSQGLKGEVKILPLTSYPERFNELTNVYILQVNGKRLDAVVEYIRWQGQTPILKIKGTNSRNESDELKGSLLQVDEANLMTLPEDAYYVHDLIGLEVITENGDRIGKVKQVWNLPANDVYVVDYQGKEVLIPYTENIVLKVDLKTKSIVINPMEGLFE